MIPRLEMTFPLRRRILFWCGKPYVPEGNEFLLDHNRSGIFLALKSLPLQMGAGVGVMVYNCHTVMNAVVRAGFRPVFLDVTDDLMLDFEDLQRKVSGLSAIVVTHLFGIINDVKRIKDAFPQLIIIEDCAHAYGISRIDGDFASFSIGQGKFPSIGDGGVLKVFNDSFMEKVKELYDSLPGYSVIQEVFLFLKLCVVSFMHRPFIYGWITLPMKRRRTVSSGQVMISPKRMCRGISAIYAKEKEVVPQMISERKSNAQVLYDELDCGVNRRMIGMNAFMLVLECDSPQQVKDYFHGQRLDTDTHFSHFLHWASGFGYTQGECPHVEKLVGHLLMVPTYCSKR